MNSYENIDIEDLYYEDIKKMIEFDTLVNGRTIQKVDDVQEIYVRLFKPEVSWLFKPEVSSSQQQPTKLIEKLEEWGGDDNPNALQNLRRLAIVLYIHNIECQFALKTEKSINRRLYSKSQRNLEKISILESRMLDKDLKIDLLYKKIAEMENDKENSLCEKLKSVYYEYF